MSDRKQQPFVMIPKALIDDERVTRADILTYLGIDYHANNTTGESRPGQDTIGRHSRLSGKPIRAAIKHLIELGYISKQRRRNKGKTTSNLYIVEPRVRPILTGATTDSDTSTGTHSRQKRDSLPPESDKNGTHSRGTIGIELDYMNERGQQPDKRASENQGSKDRTTVTLETGEEVRVVNSEYQNLLTNYPTMLVNDYFKRIRRHLNNKAKPYAYYQCWASKAAEWIERDIRDGKLNLANYRESKPKPMDDIERAIYERQLTNKQQTEQDDPRSIESPPPEPEPLQQPQPEPEQICPYCGEVYEGDICLDCIF